MHPRATAQRPPYELGVGQCGRVAEFGMVQRREVVHRGHHGRALGRRHDEVGPVHHVDASDEPLHGRQGTTTPQCVQRAGGHRAPDCDDGGRQPRLYPPPPAPTDGEGAHVEVRPPPEGVERSPAEGADPGRQSQERRGVERHPEWRPRHGSAAHALVACGTGGALHTARRTTRLGMTLATGIGPRMVAKRGAAISPIGASGPPSMLAPCSSPSAAVLVLLGCSPDWSVWSLPGPSRPSSTSATTRSSTACTSVPTSTPSPTRWPAWTIGRPVGAWPERPGPSWMSWPRWEGRAGSASAIAIWPPTSSARNGSGRGTPSPRSRRVSPPAGRSTCAFSRSPTIRCEPA